MGAQPGQGGEAGRLRIKAVPPGTDHRGRALQGCGGEGALCVALAGADFWTLGPAISACAQDVYSGENITISWPQVKFPFLLSQPLSNDNR